MRGSLLILSVWALSACASGGVSASLPGQAVAVGPTFERRWADEVPLCADTISDMTARVYPREELTTPVGYRVMAVPPTPKERLHSGAAESLVARLIVNVHGCAEPGSIIVTGSADPLYVASVRNAMRRTRFVPGTVNGTPVRAVTMAPFAFVARGP